MLENIIILYILGNCSWRLTFELFFSFSVDLIFMSCVAIHSLSVQFHSLPTICENQTDDWKSYSECSSKVRRGKKNYNGSGPRAHDFCLAYGTFFFIFLYHFYLSLSGRKATVSGDEIRYPICIRLFALYDKKWRLFPLYLTWNIKLQWINGT